MMSRANTLRRAALEATARLTVPWQRFCHLRAAGRARLAAAWLPPLGCQSAAGPRHSH